MCVLVRLCSGDILSYIFDGVGIMMVECERVSRQVGKQFDYSRYGSKVVHRSGFV